MNKLIDKYGQLTKRVVLFVALYLSLIFVGNQFEQPLANSLNKLNNIISQDINSSGGINYKNINFSYEEGNIKTDFLVNSVKSRSQVGGGFIKSDFTIHFWMPFALLLSLLVVVPAKHRWKFLIASLVLYFGFIEFKLWIQVIDECNHDVIIKDNKIMTVLIDPGFRENLISGFNKVFNIKTAVYSRYLMVFFILILTYLKIEKPKFKYSTRKLSAAH